MVSVLRASLKMTLSVSDTNWPRGTSESPACSLIGVVKPFTFLIVKVRRSEVGLPATLPAWK